MKIIFERLKALLRRRPMLVFFFYYFVRMRRGFNTYRTILKKYGSDTQIYVEHYPGTGDVYITCALLDGYITQTKGNEKYVVTIIGMGAVKVAKLLGIQNTMLLTQTETDDLLLFYRFIGRDFCPNLTVLHYSPIMFHTSVLDQLAGYNGLDFMTMYQATVFPGVSWTHAKKLPVTASQEKIDEYFDEKGLVPEKTILLFPNANTIEPLEIDLWETLARKLREDGYMVCTNVEKGGHPIPGTEAIFVPYADIIPFSERCACLIGLRSGIFDMLADSSCRKIILYPTPNFYKFGVGTIFDYFSLVKMGFAKNTYEFEFERINRKWMFYILYDMISQLLSKGTYEVSANKKCVFIKSSDVAD